MNLLVRIRNVKVLNDIIKGERFNDNNQRQFNIFCRTIFNSYQKNNTTSLERNLAAAAIKKLRPKFPYRIQGWGECQKKYNNYFNIKRAINSIDEAISKYKDLDELYVTMYTDTAYYQVDDNPFHYSTCETFLKNPVTYKVTNIKKFKNESYLELASSIDKFDRDIQVLDQEWLTAFRYATATEIEKYKKEQVRKTKLQKQIDQKAAELEQLNKQYHNGK